MTDDSNVGLAEITHKSAVEICEDDVDQLSGGAKLEIGALKAGRVESNEITPGSIRTQDV